MNQLSVYSEIVNALRSANLYPKINASQTSGASSHSQIEGEDYTIFGSSNYLGLANSQLLKSKTIESLQRHSISSGATRVLGGTHDVHNILEQKIADFLEVESSIVFSTGYMANIGVIPALANPINIPGLSSRKPEKHEVTIYSDEGNHGSIHDAIRLTVCEKEIFKHNNVEDLEEKLSKSRSERKLIITQGVFTTDGSLAPLPQLVALKEKYQSMLMIDDADGLGVMGEDGRGTFEYFGVNPKDIDILMGSMTKACGGFGGYIASTKDVIDYLRIAAKTNVLSAPLPPIISEAMITAVSAISEMKAERASIHKFAKEFKHSMEDIGFRVLGGHTPIVLIEFGEESVSLSVSKQLQDRRIYAPVIRWPAVPWGRSRIRFTFTAEHTKEDVGKLTNIMQELRKGI